MIMFDYHRKRIESN